MILRRVIAHFRKQEWTAVAIDFVIVVAGVFIGLQVNNWNEWRGAREREAFYIDRLRSEIALTERNELKVSDTRERRLQLLTEAGAAFFSGEPIDDLDTEHCEAIAYAYILVPENYAIPTLDELIATGDLALIRDPQLRLAISSFETFRNGPMARYDDLRSARASLSARFPQHFAVTGMYRGGAPEGFGKDPAREASLVNFRPSCDFAAMAGDPSFLLTFAEYASIYSYYSFFVTIPERRFFEALKAAFLAGRVADGAETTQ